MTAEEIERQDRHQPAASTPSWSLDHIALLAAQRGPGASRAGSPRRSAPWSFCSCTSTQDDALARHLAVRPAGHVSRRTPRATWSPRAPGCPTAWPRPCACCRRSSGRCCVVCGEKFSDKIGTVRTSRMIFGDGAAAMVVGPARRGQRRDIEYYQTYASGPMSEVDSIIWPNPEFDNNITVYGPEVPALVKRYLAQMIDELRRLPDPSGGSGLAAGRHRPRRPPPGQQDHGDRPAPRQPGLSPGAALLQHRAGGQHLVGQHSHRHRTTRCARASSTAPCGSSPRASGPARWAATW